MPHAVCRLTSLGLHVDVWSNRQFVLIAVDHSARPDDAELCAASTFTQLLQCMAFVART